MITPSLEEICLAACKIGLSALEAEKFYYHYESVNWRVGKNRMVSLNAALAGWKIRVQERQSKQQTGCEKWIAQKEYDRILDRLKVIRGTYGGNQNWSGPDREEYNRLRFKRDELRKKLDILL